MTQFPKEFLDVQTSKNNKVGVCLFYLIEWTDWELVSLLKYNMHVYIFSISFVELINGWVEK